MAPFTGATVCHKYLGGTRGSSKTRTGMATPPPVPPATCVPVGCAKRLPPTPPPVAATAAVASNRELLKLAKALLDGCAVQSEEVVLRLEGADVAVRPQYISRPHNAVTKQGGEEVFLAEGRKLARAFGVAVTSDAELARWGYAAWRIPPYTVPPGGVEPEQAEYSRAA